MKTMKKLLVLTLSIMMIIGTSVMTAFAETSTPSITINPANDARDTESLAINYTYYQILEASIDKDPTVAPGTGAATEHGEVAYFVTTQDRATAIEGTGLFDVTKVDGQNKWYVALKSDQTTAADLVTAFSASTFDKSKFPTGTFDKATSETSAESGTLAAGYYYIESSLGTKIAVQTLTAVTINEKNDYPSINKEDDKEFAPIDGVVTYTVTVTIPETVASKPITIYDTITEGLTLNTAVTVAGAVDDPAYTSATFVENSSYTPTAGEKQYTITIPAATVLANKGKTLTFTYTAKVNEKAVVLEPEKNDAYLTYDNFTTVKSETDVTTLAFDLQKVDGTDKTTVLTGAEFKLYDAATGGNEIPVVLKEAASAANGQINTYRVAKEGETGVVIKAGTARVEGLDAKTYYLEETKEPTGYNKLTARVAAEASKNTSAATIDYKIENNKGTELPSTGGMGTTILYIIGGVLVAGCAIMLVAKKRTENK